MKRPPLPFLLAASLALAPRPLPGQAAEFRLPSGLRCLLLEDHEQPFVRFELVDRWDPREEPADRPGLGFVLASLVKAGGAGNDDRTAFDQALDDLGMGYAFVDRRGAFTWTVAADSRNQELVLGRLADAVFRPRFDGPVLDAQRQAWLRSLKAQTPWDQGIAAFLWSLRDPGAGAPPEERVFEAPSLDEIQAFRRRVLRPENATLAIHGDLSLVQAKELVFLQFGLWKPGVGAPPATPGAPEPEAPRSLLAAPDSRDEAEFWVGAPAPAEASPALLEVLGLLLEALPQAAAPGIRRTCSAGPGEPFLMKLRASGSDRAGLPGALQASLEALRTQGFSATDLDRARIRWKARQAVLPLHPADQLHRLQAGALDPAFGRAVDALDAPAVNAALARLLAPAGLRGLLLGGDAALVQAAEKAGLGPARLVRPRS